MSLISLKEILADANSKNYIVGLFNAVAEGLRKFLEQKKKFHRNEVAEECMK